MRSTLTFISSGTDVSRNRVTWLFLGERNPAKTLFINGIFCLSLCKCWYLSSFSATVVISFMLRFVFLFLARVYSLLVYISFLKYRLKPNLNGDNAVYESPSIDFQPTVFKQIIFFPVFIVHYSPKYPAHLQFIFYTTHNDEPPEKTTYTARHYRVQKPRNPGSFII